MTLRSKSKQKTLPQSHLTYYTKISCNAAGKLKIKTDIKNSLSKNSSLINVIANYKIIPVFLMI